MSWLSARARRAAKDPDFPLGRNGYGISLGSLTWRSSFSCGSLKGSLGLAGGGGGAGAMMGGSSATREKWTYGGREGGKWEKRSMRGAGGGGRFLG